MIENSVLNLVERIEDLFKNLEEFVKSPEAVMDNDEPDISSKNKEELEEAIRILHRGKSKADGDLVLQKLEDVRSRMENHVMSSDWPRLQRHEGNHAHSLRDTLEKAQIRKDKEKEDEKLKEAAVKDAAKEKYRKDRLEFVERIREEKIASAEAHAQKQMAKQAAWKKAREEKKASEDTALRAQVLEETLVRSGAQAGRGKSGQTPREVADDEKTPVKSNRLRVLRETVPRLQTGNEIPGQTTAVKETEEARIEAGPEAAGSTNDHFSASAILIYHSEATDEVWIGKRTLERDIHTDFVKDIARKALEDNFAAFLTERLEKVLVEREKEDFKQDDEGKPILETIRNWIYMLPNHPFARFE